MSLLNIIQEGKRNLDYQLNQLALAMRMLEGCKNIPDHTVDMLNKHNENCNKEYAKTLEISREQTIKLLEGERERIRNLIDKKPTKLGGLYDSGFQDAIMLCITDLSDIISKIKNK